jgi:PAS domain S-box-containing protein
LINKFIENLKEYILKVDLKGRIIFISEKFLAKFESKEEDYLDKDLSGLLTPSSKTILKTILQNLHQVTLISQIFLEFKLRAGQTLFCKCDFSKMLFKKKSDFILVFCEEIIIDNFIAKELQKYQLIANMKNQLFFDYYTDTQIGKVYGDLSILSGIEIRNDNEVYVPDIVEKVHPEDRKSTVQKQQEGWDNNAFSIYQYRLQTESGKYIHIQSINHVVPDDGGERKHVFGILRSVPKGDIMNSNLESNQSRLQTIYENISEVIWEIKPNTALNFISTNIKKVLGWETSEIINNKTNIIDLIHPKDQIHYENALNKLVYQSTLFDIEYRIKHKDKSWRWVHDRAIDITSEKNGKLFIGMLVDITEKKRIEAIRLNALKLRSSEFFAKGTAYELEIISSNIHANVLLLEKIIPKTSETKIFCKQLQKHTSNLTHIAEALYLYKGKAPNPEFTRNLMEIIKSIVGPVVQDYNIEVNYSFDEKIWNIKVNDVHIFQIIEFITYKAVNAMNYDGNLTIEVRNLILEKENDYFLEAGLYIITKFTDDGLALSKEESLQLMNPISPFNFETPQIGLEILSSFISSKEGKFSIEARLGKGNCITIILPAFK